MDQLYRAPGLDNIIEKALTEFPIQQGIIGIFFPEPMGTMEDFEFHSTLIGLGEILKYDFQAVILPPPLRNWFDVNDKLQMEALARRVDKDKTDGIRNNRVYIALYTDYPTDEVIKAHDFWFDTHKEGFTTVAEFTIYREGYRAVSETKSPEFIAASAAHASMLEKDTTNVLAALNLHQKHTDEPMYLHGDLNSKGEPVIKDQHGNELKPTAEDLVPRPFNLNGHLGNPEATEKIVVGNSMKGVIQRVLLDDELPKSELGERTPEILFSNKSLFLRMTTPPTVGDVLKSNFGYDKEDSHIRLAEETGFTENITKGILDNKYPALLTIHLIAISKATNGNYEYWSDVHETHCKWLEFNRNTDGNR